MLAIFQHLILNDTSVPNGKIFEAPRIGASGEETEAQAQKQRAKIISTILAAVVADGLARSARNGYFPYSGPIFLLPNRTTDGNNFLQGRVLGTLAREGADVALNTSNVADTAHWLRLNPTFQRYGYGYHWRGSHTAQFGISILLIHLVVAVAHTAYILREVVWKRRGLPGCWESIPEFFALAINSRPSEHLKNTCVGMSESKTWGMRVAVREASKGHLEMVLERNEIEQMEMAQTGVKYGAWPHVTSGGKRPREQDN